MRLRHSPFTIDQTARNVWVQPMLAALDEADIPDPARATIQEYFERTATHLINA